MIVDEFAIPSQKEADRLLAGLSRLIGQRGYETFVCAPLLLAEPHYFPDRIEPRAPGVVTLVRRLMAYAGLEPKRIELEIFGDSHDPLIAKGDSHAGASAWFMDVADGVYRFGVLESELRHADGLVGILGHEVAHAYRHHHQLCVRTRSVEEQLTDLTTVYLGFGVFTLETSYQFKTGHYSNTGERLLFERQTRGYLKPGQLAFLLAAQLVARGARDTDTAAVLASLSPNQAAALRTALARLRADEATLLDKLGLPSPDTWPAIDDQGEPLPQLADAELVIVDRPKALRDHEQRVKIGFRIAGSRLAEGATLGLCVGFAGAIMLGLELWFWPCVLALTATGFLLGRRRPAPTCSGCRHKVAVDAARCEFCELKLVGDVTQKLEVLDAEDRYREQLRASRAAEQASSPRRRCPVCAWVPAPSDVWFCRCGHRWDTFETRALCPACGKQWETTACLSCKATSPHDEWYAQQVHAPRTP